MNINDAWLRNCLLILAGVFSYSAYPCLGGEEPQWGYLTGKFVSAETSESQRELSTSKVFRDRGIRVFDESWVVDEATHGLANVLIFVEERALLADSETADETAFRIHPDLVETRKQPVELSMEQGRFAPHIILLQVDQELVLVGENLGEHAPNFGVEENTPP